MIMGKQTEKKKPYTIKYICTGTPEESDRILRQFARDVIQKVLDKHGAVAYNLDEVLNKYISEEMRNEQKRNGRRSGICEGFDPEGFTEG